MTGVPRQWVARHYAAHQVAFDEAYRRVMGRGEFILGNEVEAFEREFADYCAVEHCIGVGNGLDALTLILRALGIGAGDEVIVPAHTFIATHLAVAAVGAVPVLVDVHPATFNLDPARVAPAITERTRAIVAVHLFGQPAEMAPLLALAAQHGLRVIEDAAQAHGATSAGRRVGGLATTAAFSFYPAKNLGAFGDGGAVTTSDGTLAESIRRLRNYGSTDRYRHDVVGVNSRLDELQAAFLRVSLAELATGNARRSVCAERYFAGLRDRAPRVRLPVVASGVEAVWHQYVIQCDERDALQAFLAARSIETLIHYPIPPHLQPAFASGTLGRVPASGLATTEHLARTSLSLPIHPYLTTAEQDEVIAAIREFCSAPA